MSFSEDQDRDAIAFGKVLGVGVIFVAIGVAATAWSAFIERPIPPQVLRRSPPSQRTHAIEDGLYDTTRGEPLAPGIRHQQLDSWTWADRGRMRVNLPIRDAMDRWLERHQGKRGKP